MANCLAQAINVRGCGNTPLVYLNSLPGISLKSLDLIKNEEQHSYVDVINDVRERAANRVTFDFFASSNVEFTLLPHTNCVGRISEPLQLLPPSGGEGGILFDFVTSKYLSLRIVNLYFKSDVVQTITFFVKDVVTNEVLDTIVADLVIGENEIPVNKLYYPTRTSTKLFVGYDLSTTGYYKTSIEDCYEGCNGCRVLGTCGCRIARAFNGNTPSQTTYGLGILYTEECSFDKFVCDNINLFLQPLLYASGIEFVHELIGSTRLNSITSMPKDAREALLTNYTDMYEKSMKLLLKKIDLCDTCCFRCHDNKYNSIFVYP